MSSSVYGIDLGTTYSAIARISDLGAAEIIPNFEGDQTTPSVVFFESPGSAIVGAEAKRSAIQEPENAAMLIKRHMGTEYPQIFQGETYTPEAISALILKELVTAANKESGGEASTVVITVPAYFGVQEREATRQAGTIAGLEVVGIVTEPVAAALSIGLKGESAETIMVYDLGGGTFDTTIMALEAGKVRVIAVDGNRQLGGADWDAALVDLIVEKFMAEVDLDGEDPRHDEEFFLDIRLAAEETKKSLTKRESATVKCDFQGKKANITVTRQEFEEATKHLIAQTIEICRRTLEIGESKEPGLSVDRVLLVGGSSRMPMVRESLKRELGWDAQDTDFDLAVAKGAAIYGQAAVEEVLIVEGQSEEAAEAIAENAAPKYYLAGAGALSITNVLSRGVGIEFSRNGDPDDNYIQFFAHSNDEIPMAPDPITAGTLVANQRSVSLKLYEQGGERESEAVADNRLMKEASLTLPEGLPKGAPVELQMHISGEGLVTLTATDPATGSSVTMEAMVSVLSEEDVAAETAKVSGITLRS